MTLRRELSDLAAGLFYLAVEFLALSLAVLGPPLYLVGGLYAVATADYTVGFYCAIYGGGAPAVGRLMHRWAEPRIRARAAARRARAAWRAAGLSS